MPHFFLLEGGPLAFEQTGLLADNGVKLS